MENFTGLRRIARVYDMFQDNVDYDVWGSMAETAAERIRHFWMDWCWILDAAPER